MRRLASFVVGCAIGAVWLYVFFTTLADISPLEVASVSAAVGIVALLLVLRSVRVAAELRDPGGDPFLRRSRNRARERRGF